MADLKALIEEFRGAYEAGEAPDTRSFLERASPEERQTLAAEIDSYLMTAPRRPWDAAAYADSPAQRAVERAWQSLDVSAEPLPELLPSLRNRAQIKRKELVARLADALGVAGKEEKVGDYYHQLEHGQLPPSGVSGRVFDALGEILDTSADRLRSAGRAMRPPESGAPAFTRFAAQSLEHADADWAAEPPEAPADPGAAEGPDEVDELFTGG